MHSFVQCARAVHKHQQHQPLAPNLEDVVTGLGQVLRLGNAWPHCFRDCVPGRDLKSVHRNDSRDLSSVHLKDSRTESDDVVTGQRMWSPDSDKSCYSARGAGGEEGVWVAVAIAWMSFYVIGPSAFCDRSI